MLFKWITNCVLYLTLIYLTRTDAEDNFRAVKGDAVCLPCSSPITGSEQVDVEWRKHSNHSSRTTICKWIIYNITRSSAGECIPGFKFNISSFTLSIENVQLSDSGNYSCKTTRIIPPPALDYTSNVTIQVAVLPHLSLEKLNSSNETCVHLLCSLKSVTAEPVNFTWDREGHGSLHSFITYNMNSELLLCKPDWSDGDTITCYANYSQTLYTNSSIRLTLKKNSYEDFLVPIILCSAAAGLILCIIIITVVICKCRKQGENGSIVFSNKVYENFSFAMTRQNTQLHDKPQPEECIYEN